jgi:hypothetical protein
MIVCGGRSETNSKPRWQRMQLRPDVNPQRLHRISHALAAEQAAGRTRLDIARS